MKAAKDAQHGTQYAQVIRALLSEDLTGRLERGETTEALEAMKVRDDGPIMESMKEVTNLVKSKMPGLS